MAHQLLDEIKTLKIDDVQIPQEITHGKQVTEMDSDAGAPDFNMWVDLFEKEEPSIEQDQTQIKGM